MNLKTAPHELDVNFITGVHPEPGTPDYGLKSYYALHSIVSEYDDWKTDGKPSREMEFNGETWAIVLDYQDSGLDPMPSPEFSIQNVKEYRLYFVSKDSPHYRDAPADQQDRVKGGSVHVAPRWPDLTSDGTPVSVPDYGAPYVNFEIQGSNIPHEDYHDLLKRLLDAFDVSPRYVDRPHPDSNVQDLARYVRPERGESGPIFAADGPIARTHTVIQGDRSGYRKHVEDHTELPGNDVRSYVDSSKADTLIRGHELGKELKHYYDDPHAYERTDAPYHPKFEVAYQTSITDKTVRWSEIDDAVRELDETLLNCLDWAGIAPTSDASIWVDFDPYWNVEDTHQSRKLVPDPLPDIEDEQEHMVMKMWGNMTDADRDVTEHLLTDGGTVSPQEAADATGNTYRTVRAVCDRMSDLIRHTYGEMEIESKHVQQELLKRVRTATDRFEDEIGSTAMELADAAKERTRTAWDRARRRYSVTVDEDGDDYSQELIKIDYQAQDKSEADEILATLKSRYEGDAYGVKAEIETLEDGLISITNLGNWSHKGNSKYDYTPRDEQERRNAGFDWDAWRAAGCPPREDWTPD
jgi:hypothetical protein